MYYTVLPTKIHIFVVYYFITMLNFIHISKESFVCMGKYRLEIMSQGIEEEQIINSDQFVWVL